MHDAFFALQSKSSEVCGGLIDSWPSVDQREAVDLLAGLTTKRRRESAYVNPLAER